MKKNKTKLQIGALICVIVILSALLVAAGLDILAVKERYTTTVKTDVFTVNGVSASTPGLGVDTSENYYLTLTATASQSVDVYRAHYDGYGRVSYVDLLLYHSQAADFNLTSANYTSVTDFTLSDGSTCTLYRKVAFVGADVATGGIVPEGTTINYSLTKMSLNLNATEGDAVKVVVLPSGEVTDKNFTYNNIYVANFFDLQLANNNTSHNRPFENLLSNPEYRNIYFLDDLVIPESFTLTTPCYLNLLYADLTLDADLTIENSYSGYYQIDLIPNADTTVRRIVNTVGKFTLNTVNGYYATEKIVGVISDPTAPQFVKNDGRIDLTANPTVVYGIMTDANTFIKSLIPKYLFGDITLPTSYLSYKVSYAYVANSPISLDASGNCVITQSADNTTATINYIISNEYNTTTLTDSITVTVVGSSDSALLAVANDYLKDYIAVSGTLVNTGDSSVLGKIDIFDKIDLLSVLSYLSKEREGVTFKVNVSDIIKTKVLFICPDSASASYPLNGTKSDDIYLVNEGGTLKVSSDNVTYYAISSQDKAYVSGYNYVYDGEKTAIKLYVATSGVDSSVPVTLNYAVKGMTREEVNRYLESKINELYFKDDTDVGEILQIAGGMLYSGSTVTDPLNTAMGIARIDYRVVLISDEQYSALVNNTITLATAVANGSVWCSYIDGVEAAGDLTFGGSGNFNGTLSVTSGRYVSVSSGYKLILAQNFVYSDDGGVTTGEYGAYRRIMVSSAGVGGGEYAQYQKGDTFAGEFNSITDNRLINPEGEAALNKGFTNLFESNQSGVYLLMMAFCDGQLLGTTDFCYMQPTLVGSYYNYSIVINTSLIPPMNKTINVLAIFYTKPDKVNAGDNDNDLYLSSDSASDYYYNAEGMQKYIISEQNYSFVVPGVYDATRFSAELFNAIITSTDLSGKPKYDFYTSVVGGVTSHYLYVDEANKAVEVFDCSNKGITDLKGLNLLTNTKKIILDGNNITQGFDVFANFAEYNVTELSFVNCRLTNALIQDYLTKVITLEKVNLSGNNITSLKYGNSSIFYRTLKELVLSNMNDNGTKVFSDLDGLEKLSELTTLDLSENIVSDFRNLLNLATLKTVYVYNNTGREFTVKHIGDANTYYGTDGQINKPVFILLTDLGVTVYSSLTVTEGVTTYNAFAATADERLAALIVNAVIAQTDHYGAINLPSSVYELSSSGTNHAITVEYVLSNNIVKIDNFGNFSVTDGTRTHGKTAFGNDAFQVLANDGLTEGLTIDVIISVSINGTTVYRQFTFIYHNAVA